MPDQPGRPGDEITRGHPSAQLRAAPNPGDEPPTAGPLAFPAEHDPPPGVVTYGPDIGDETTLRLLPGLEGRRVLELGAGGGHNAVTLARQGAHVIVVDPSARRLEHARERCDAEQIRVELHQSALAELAFVRADSVDLVLSVFALASVTDLDRVFRQAHRVLRREAPLVFSLPHPAFVLTRGGSYFDDFPRTWTTEEGQVEEVPRSVADIFGGLARANFRVDALLEPEPVAAPRSRFWVDAMARAPMTLIVRARKEGL